MTSQKLSALLLYAGTVHTVMQNTRPCKTRFITGIIITVVMNSWTISQPNPAFNLFKLINTVMQLFRLCTLCKTMSLADARTPDMINVAATCRVC